MHGIRGKTRAGFVALFQNAACPVGEARLFLLRIRSWEHEKDDLIKLYRDFVAMGLEEMGELLWLCTRGVLAAEAGILFEPVAARRERGFDTNRFSEGFYR